ncbi:hypothetical protein BB559_004762 [Furculomyces boomerangus]|uniref:Glucosamine-6-phosphate isomerase n=2 Tax=Harpellales TaxID=61421 RepID=A0A2T9YCT8_9FUNG|nr:hypothetical protein BB559_004762 [Furculomyces boomerangus]PVZ99233.1 hypothetical protein BB558_004751 [Smittium angustum]
MRLVIREDEDNVAYYAANYLRKRIIEFNPTPQKPFVIGLTDDSTAIKIYKILVSFHKIGEISFQNVIAFLTDEYVGLSIDHPASNYSFVNENLFKHVDFKQENINFIDGNANDLDKECKRYEQKINQVGGIELLLGGIGPDGHIAFNEPGSSIMSRTRMKTLAYETVLVNAKFFENDIKKVPKLALTIGIQTIMDSREIVMIITGAHKALALSKCVEGGVNHMWLVSSIQLHPSAMVICDEDATLELYVKTVRYFKSIEKVQEQLIGSDNIGLKGSISSLSKINDRCDHKKNSAHSDRARHRSSMSETRPF